MNALRAKHKSIGEVRGIGLFWAVELVKNQATKESFNSYKDKVGGVPLLIDKVAAEMMKNGVFVQAWVSHFVIAPPLIITKQEIDTAVKVLDDALHIAGYYRGLIYDTNMVKEALKAAKTFIEKIPC